jgi:hypothetical protein
MVRSPFCFWKWNLPFRQLILRRFSPFLHIVLSYEAKHGQRDSKFLFYSLSRPLPSMMDEYFYHLPIEVRLLFLSLLGHCCHVIFLTNRLQHCEASDLRLMSMWNFIKICSVKTLHGWLNLTTPVITMWLLQLTCLYAAHWRWMYLTCLNFSQCALDCSPTVNISEKYVTNCWPMHSFHLLLQKISRANLSAANSNNSLPFLKIWCSLYVSLLPTYYIITGTFVL